MMLAGNRGAITLVELLVAMFILASVVLAAATLDISSRRFFRGYIKETKVLNEISLIVEQIVKDVFQGNDIVLVDPGPNQYRGISIRQDKNNTPENFSDDSVREYRFYIDEKKISNVVNSNEEIISANITNAEFTLINDNTTLFMDIVGRYDATQSSSPDNPELSLSSAVTVRGKAAD